MTPKPVSPQIGGNPPSLSSRIRFALGNTIWRAGVTLHWVWLSRLGWDVSTLSWKRGHVCKCGRRSRTERAHLTHYCSDTAWRAVGSN